ncbi:MAG: hypothetical protein RI909_935 [Bacteroidota bacterium]|jgi:hypothetical protein
MLWMKDKFKIQLSFIFYDQFLFTRLVAVKHSIQRANNVRSQVEQPIM